MKKTEIAENWYITEYQSSKNMKAYYLGHKCNQIEFENWDESRVPDIWDTYIRVFTDRCYRCKEEIPDEINDKFIFITKLLK